MPKLTKAQQKNLESAAEAAGLDVKGIDWSKFDITKLVALVQMILDMIRARSPELLEKKGAGQFKKNGKCCHIACCEHQVCLGYEALEADLRSLEHALGHLEMCKAEEENGGADTDEDEEDEF